MALFGKKHEVESAGVFRRDPRKAKRFFDHAKAVADSHNFDYAIDCYISGLRHEPANQAMHEALREVALKRKVNGGKPARLTEKFKKGGKDAIGRLLRAETLWSKDPLNTALLIDVMTRMAQANEAEPDLGLDDLVLWVGGIVLEYRQAAKQPNKAVYIQARDLFAQLGAYAQAVDACRLALRLDPDNAVLNQDLKNLDAELAMQVGNYGQEDEEGGFKSSVKDMDQQKQLAHQDAITKTASGVDDQIQRSRAQYEEQPGDLDRLNKLVNALLQKEAQASENEAIGLLESAFEQTNQYRYKQRVADVRIKQMNRRLRALHAQVQASPQDQALRQRFQTLSRKKLLFEHEEYTRRVEHYPTDLGLRYELGRRLLMLGKHDDAISAFQQSKVDPKYRIVSLELLARCYAAKGWLDEAVDTLRQGIDAYHSSDDRLAMEMRYLLMTVLKQLAAKNQSLDQAKEAQRIASQVLQTDIHFREIRQQMEQIRQLVDQLAKQQQSGV